MDDWSSCRASGRVPGGDVLLNVASFLQLGGRWHESSSPNYPSIPVAAGGFEGCIKDLMHDTKVYLRIFFWPQWNISLCLYSCYLKGEIKFYKSQQTNLHQGGLVFYILQYKYTHIFLPWILGFLQFHSSSFYIFCFLLREMVEFLPEWWLYFSCSNNPWLITNYL